MHLPKLGVLESSLEISLHALYPSCILPPVSIPFFVCNRHPYTTLLATLTKFQSCSMHTTPYHGARWRAYKQSGRNAYGHDRKRDYNA